MSNSLLITVRSILICTVDSLAQVWWLLALPYITCCTGWTLLLRSGMCASSSHRCSPVLQLSSRFCSQKNSRSVSNLTRPSKVTTFTIAYTDDLQSDHLDWRPLIWPSVMTFTMAWTDNLQPDLLNWPLTWPSKVTTFIMTWTNDFQPDLLYWPTSHFVSHLPFFTGFWCRISCRCYDLYRSWVHFPLCSGFLWQRGDCYFLHAFHLCHVDQVREDRQRVLVHNLLPRLLLHGESTNNDNI